jgi:hypothetical protein
MSAKSLCKTWLYKQLILRSSNCNLTSFFRAIADIWLALFLHRYIVGLNKTWHGQRVVGSTVWNCFWFHIYKQGLQSLELFLERWCGIYKQVQILRSDLYLWQKDSGPLLESRVAGLRRVSIQDKEDFKDFTNYTWGYQVSVLCSPTAYFISICKAFNLLLFMLLFLLAFRNLLPTNFPIMLYMDYSRLLLLLLLLFSIDLF